MDGLQTFYDYKIIYPSYIDSSLKVSEGRKISKDHAVERPTTKDIEICLRKLGYSCTMENGKGYPRDTLRKGRIKVKFLKENGDFAVSNITTKKMLLREVARLVGQLASRNEDSNEAASGSSQGSRKRKKGRKR